MNGFVVAKLLGAAAAKGIANSAGSGVGKPIAEKAKTRFEQWTGRYWSPSGLEQELPALDKHITQQLGSLVKAEDFRDLAANEKVAAARELADILSQTDLLALILDRCRLNPHALATYLSEEHAGRSGELFSDVGNAYYHHLTGVISGVLVRLADRIACYIPARDRQILSGLDSNQRDLEAALDDLQQILTACDRFTGLVARQDERRHRNELHYLRAVRGNLNRADYFGIPDRNEDDSISAFPLHVAYISLHATSLTQPLPPPPVLAEKSIRLPCLAPRR